MEQLYMLDLPDQASVLCSRLGRIPPLQGADEAGGAVDKLTNAAAGGPAGETVARSELRHGPGSTSALTHAFAAHRADSVSMARGERRLAELVVQELSSKHYSLSHGLLASLPVTAVVTTNYDTLFEEAWRGAQADFHVLPYETGEADRWTAPLSPCVHEVHRSSCTDRVVSLGRSAGLTPAACPPTSGGCSNCTATCAGHRTLC
jgi:hypothetical protein